MLYPANKVNSINLKKRSVYKWDIRKNIEEEEKWAQKREGLVKEIKENKLLSERN